MLLGEISGTRGASVPKGKSSGRVELAVSDLDFESESVFQVGTKIEIAIRGENAETPHCETLTEYILRIEVAGDDPSLRESESFIAAVRDFALRSSLSSHRERVMELTMRMEVPVFRIPVTMDAVEARADAAGSAD
jgi:hypothetical protein